MGEKEEGWISVVPVAAGYYPLFSNSSLPFSLVRLAWLADLNNPVSMGPRKPISHAKRAC